METTHLKYNDGTKCGFRPKGFLSSQKLIEVTCWDCINSQFSDYDFKEKTEIYESERIVRLSVLFRGEDVASLNYYHGSFMPIIMDVWVSPNFRGKGLGTVIMKRIMKIAGPPIQLKAEPFNKSSGDAPGLEEPRLRDFYASLGFVPLTGSKMMLWYPVVKDSTFQVKVENEDGYYIASVVGYPEINRKGTDYNLAIGNLVFDHSQFFGINFVKSDAVCLVNEEDQEERT